ncbi:VOC family protein [uncultured Actinomyces sp.]|uniref:VOC family protein n=1 Tax=uncultured Actinomyces sp. TaxID=249061 RepID=UPI0028D59ACA|nr:VOC family protein [uncultured Actinomyces sp.]
MSTFNAFEMSPVPVPAEDARPPEPFHGIYGMPMFITVPTLDLDASVDFWTEALGFFTLFSIPGRLVHLRRWAFQDLLLVPAPQEPIPATGPVMSVSFACVLSQIDEIAKACERLRPGSVTGPRITPWNSREVEVATPEGVRVVLTAARPLDPGSEQAEGLRRVGIEVPEA